MHLLTRSPRGGSGRRLATRGPLTVLLTLGLLAPVGALAPAAADVPTDEPYAAAAGWVARQLADDADPSAGRLADAILAFAATGTAGDATATAADQLEALAPTADDNAGALAKLVLAASAAGRDVNALGEPGFDAEAELRAEMVATGDDAGRFGGSTQLFVQSLAVLALATTDAGVPAEAVSFLADRACEDGSFNFPGTGCGDVDVTALATQALHAGGADTSAQEAYLLDAQDEATGAFLAYGDPNANSTALAAQALRALDEDAAADAAAAFVASLQKGCETPVADRGAIATYPDGDGSLWLATTQGVLAAAPSLDQLDATGASPEAGVLSCSEGTFCPTTTGVSVVVDFTVLDPDRDPVVGCATDLAEDATALEALAAAGFDPTIQDFGGDLGEALCAVDDLPELPEGECFDPSGSYWSFWTAERGGTWTSSDVGAGSVEPEDGSVVGFAWGSFPADPPRVLPADPVEPEPQPEPPYDRGTAAACPGTYPDAFVDTAGSTHERAIRCLAEAGITTGTRDPRRYDPLGDLTRAQLASLLARAYETTTGAPLPAGEDAFPDDDGSVHEANIDRLAASGVIRGVGDGSRFAPNADVTRGQMASLIARFLDLLDDDARNGSLPAATDRDVFADDDGSTHEDNVDRLAAVGIVQGRRDGTYGVLDDVRRDQVASFVARAIDLAVSEGVAEPIA